MCVSAAPRPRASRAASVQPILPQPPEVAFVHEHFLAKHDVLGSCGPEALEDSKTYLVQCSRLAGAGAVAVVVQCPSLVGSRAFGKP